MEHGSVKNDKINTILDAKGDMNAIFAAIKQTVEGKQGSAKTQILKEWTDAATTLENRNNLSVKQKSLGSRAKTVINVIRNEFKTPSPPGQRNLGSPHPLRLSQRSGGRKTHVRKQKRKTKKRRHTKKRRAY
jgi:hypothetical protein